jgi:hypothetical protein
MPSVHRIIVGASGSPVQSLLAGLADDHAVYDGLQAFDGLLILGIGGYLYARARQRES